MINPTSTATSTVDEIDLAFDFGDAGLQQSQSILKCSVDAWHAEAYFSPQIVFVDARDLDNQPMDVTTRLCLDCGKSRPTDYGGTAPSDYDNCSANLCGDVVVDGVYSTSDAQLLLKTAVGNPPSYRQRYDVDRDGRIVAIDALRVLRHAVGLPSTLFCAPPPLAECDVVQPPVTSTTTPAASDVGGN